MKVNRRYPKPAVFYCPPDPGIAAPGHCADLCINSKDNLPFAGAEAEKRTE